MPRASANEIQSVLPKKGFWRQISDGINTWFDGAGWFLTMQLAKTGALGPEIGAQSREIERTMAAGLLAAESNPGQTASALSAIKQQYPWQTGARFATGAFMTRGWGAKPGVGNSLLLGTAVGEGSMAHSAFNAGKWGISPDVLLVAAVAGEVCGN